MAKKGAKKRKGKGKVECKADSSKHKQNEENSCEDCEDCDECCQCRCECDCNTEMQPCFVEATRPEPGPEAYDEFEACLNGSGLTIRVLKDTHKVDCVDDGAENDLGADDDECYRQDVGECDGKGNGVNAMLQRSTFARNHIKRRTGGKIVNHPNIPKVRANIKYSGNDACEADNYYVPFSKIKEVCDQQEAKVDCYRRRLCGGASTPVPPPEPPNLNQRSCCMQVERRDITNAMKGVNDDARQKGIEVCYKTCDETDSDVFLVKLGSKSKSQKKKNTIEIELRTPKQPLQLPSRKVTTETYVTEALLDSAMGSKKSKKGGGKSKKKKK